MTDQLDLLRSILHSDDDLQIRPSGDFHQVCIKLDFNIQIRFLIDPDNLLTKSLFIKNLNDLRIYKLGNNKTLLKHEQWINIRDYFNELIQQESNANSSIYSIIQLIQERILEILKSNEKKESIKSTAIFNADASTPIEKFRGADLIYNRIAYDSNIDRSHVVIGYEDRFTGIHEVVFNEFKKVHDDRYGILMHRIRYFKINQRIVWDRSKKIDFLTGGDMTEYNQLKPSLIQGMYRFDPSTKQWILCPDIVPLSEDDSNSSSTNDMCLPERCRFVTWNIFSSETHYNSEQYREIIKTLKSFLPDIICLQSVTKDFLDLLLEEQWLKSKNYYIIIMKSILNTNQESSSGQLMLMKNFRPRAFSICSLDLSTDAVNRKRNECIIARFGLNSKITIDIINLHLYNLNENISKDFEDFLKTMNTKNFMIIGDFNFGDEDILEENIIKKYKYQIHDLWKDIYDIDENPGYTFDPKRNTCAKQSSNSSIGFRPDRYLLHKLPNLFYSIEHLNMIGLETILIDSETTHQINQSNHYGLQLIINFQLRTISQRSALVLSPLIESFRKKESNQWSGHINLLCPFFDLKNTEDEEESILLPLRLLLTQYEPFDIEINPLNDPSKRTIKQLIEQIKQFFSHCHFDFQSDSNPYMVTTRSDTNQTQPATTSTEPIRFSIRYIYILQQSLESDDTAPYHITHQLPLGSVLQPIGFNQSSYIDNDLREVFNSMNLYHEKKFFEQKQDKFDRLSTCFENVFNNDTLHCFTYTYLPYGSFRLGLHGEDLDTVFLLTEKPSTAEKTDLDKKFLQLKSDLSILNNCIINLLETEIMNYFKDDIIDCRTIQAIYPIISILFNDHTRVEIFVQSIFDEQYQNEKNLLLNFYQNIHGVHDIECLITYVRFPPIFQHLLTFIRTWAQNVGLYGQVYGYLGGYSWAILCAYICHQQISSIDSSFSLQQFHLLVEKFFSTYSQFNWLYESLCLYSHHSSSDYRGSMRIICPNPPYNNTSRSTINSTRSLIIQGFKNAQNKSYEDILQLKTQFPDSTIQSILQLRLSGQTINELNQWLGYMKSRLAHFLNDCENECDLFIQTDNKTEMRTNPLERFYSIGFQVNEHILSHHRDFYYCLNKFLDQFKICTFRTDTMKLSYKLMSIHHWIDERMKISN